MVPGAAQYVPGGQLAMSPPDVPAYDGGPPET